MKLFYATETCSMTCVNAIKELGIPCSLIEVSFKQNQNVDELNRLNPLGLTPTLVTDSGRVLTQNVAILEYLADQKPESGLLAPVGTIERAETVAWMSFVAAELQKAFIPAFRAESMAENPEAQKQIENFARSSVQSYLEYVDQSLKGKSFIHASGFTIADCYLFVILGWSEWIDIDLKQYKEITAYRKRVSDRPAIQQALALEKA